MHVAEECSSTLSIVLVFAFDANDMRTARHDEAEMKATYLSRAIPKQDRSRERTSSPLWQLSTPGTDTCAAKGART
jgi:hypothetical protein